VGKKKKKRKSGRIVGRDAVFMLHKGGGKEDGNEKIRGACADCWKGGRYGQGRKEKGTLNEEGYLILLAERGAR